MLKCLELKAYYIKNITDGFLIKKLRDSFLLVEELSTLKILRLDLQEIKKVVYSNDNISLYSIYANFNTTKVFLDCSDDNLLYLIDLESGKVKTIQLHKKPFVFFPGRYSWKEQLILSAGEDRFFLLDEINFKIVQINGSVVQKLDSNFFKFHQVSLNYDVVRFYPYKYSFIYYIIDENILGYYSVIEDNHIIIDYKNWYNPYGTGLVPRFFDVQYIEGGVFVLIDENLIEIRKGEKTFSITCPKHMCFTSAVPFVKDGENHLTVLSYDKGNCKKSFLEQYKIPKI